MSPPVRGAHRHRRSALIQRGRHREVGGRHRRPPPFIKSRLLMAVSVVALLGLSVPLGFLGSDPTDSPISREATLEKFGETPASTLFNSAPQILRESVSDYAIVSELDGRRYDGVFAFLSSQDPALVALRETEATAGPSSVTTAADSKPNTPAVTATTRPRPASSPAAPAATRSGGSSPATTTTRPASGGSSPATTTTTQSVAVPAAPPVSVAGAVVVSPGQSIQAAVDSHGAGTTFLIKAGVHRSQHVVPKDGDVFVGEPGAVLSGEGSIPYAFSGMGADNVRIQGLVVERYTNPLQTGAIRYVSGAGSQGWVVEGNEVRFNKGHGIQAGPLWRVLGNNVHHNGQLGISGSGGEILVEGNEIAFNNTDSNDPGWEAGGTKFVYTSRLVLRGNYVHDNKGPGLWTDINNIYVLFENNRVVNNDGPGIYQEVGYDAVIRNNVVEGNGFQFEGWIDGAGILVSSSRNVEVYGNTVRGNNDGIAAKHVSRPDAAVADHGPWELRNLWVHDNVISMNVGQSGIVANTGSGEVWSSWGNRFDRNTYTLGGNAKYYEWGGTQLSTSQWKQAGQDPNGTWK